ncbi:hypothetical protein [Chromobacterium phragmitis]|uniref:hypothetical protein n=1 Tax=Chromobacterium phragmitis TaxID=2202141 RepID=UPI0011AE2640|nr:hypothetical protein [Chromobacterium phragmitis]
MRHKKINFANLVCRSGDNTMLDMFDHIIYPAFFGEALERTYGSTTFVFHGVKLVNLRDDGDLSGLAIVGRIIRDAHLKAEQRFENGALKEVDDTLHSSPSSMFALFLHNHRMAYVQEHAGSPSLKLFRSTLEYFVKKIYRLWLKEQRALVRRGRPRSQWVELRENFTHLNPMPTIDIVPLVDERNIRDAILEMGSISSLVFEVVRTNDEVPPGSVLDAVRKKKVKLGNPKNAILKYSDSENTFDIAEAAESVIEAVQDQNTLYTVKGQVGTANVQYSNQINLDDNAEMDKIAISVPLINANASLTQMARQASQEYTALKQHGRVAEPEMVGAGVGGVIIGKLTRIFERYMR